MPVKIGERKHQILQVLAEMLGNPHRVKITTATLAENINVTESALYRHFASKAQIYEGLIDFIEQTLFTFINKLTAEEKRGVKQVEGILLLLISFSHKNPGLTRILVGDALVNENERLQLRINQLHDRLEVSLKQALRFAANEQTISTQLDVAAYANLLMCYVTGCWHQFVKSGFRRDPLEHWETQRQVLLPSPLLDLNGRGY